MEPKYCYTKTKKRIDISIQPRQQRWVNYLWYPQDATLTHIFGSVDDTNGQKNRALHTCKGISKLKEIPLSVELTGDG